MKQIHIALGNLTKHIYGSSNINSFLAAFVIS